MIKYIFCFIIAVCTILPLEAKKMIVAGFVYPENQMGGMPFSSVWLLNPTTGEIEYSAFTDTNGWYNLGEIETERIYILKVTSPLTETYSKKIKPKYFEIEGNVSYHIGVKIKKNASMLIPIATYSPEVIAPNAKKVEELYRHIPDITFEDGYFTDKNGGGVRILFKGVSLSTEEYDYVLENLPIEYIKSIEYYDISNSENPVYTGVLNFNLPDVNIPRILINDRIQTEYTDWDI